MLVRFIPVDTCSSRFIARFAPVPSAREELTVYLSIAFLRGLWIVPSAPPPFLFCYVTQHCHDAPCAFLLVNKCGDASRDLDGRAAGAQAACAQTPVVVGPVPAPNTSA